MAAMLACFLASCSATSDESTSQTRACAPKTFACNGHTPGFWSNKNGCDRLEADATLYVRLNAFLEAVGLANAENPVDTCDEVDALLKVDANPMSEKLLAMWVAFALNQWSWWEGDCYGEDLYFKFAPGGASAACKDAVDAWFADDLVSYGELADLTVALLTTSTETLACEQETLKNFLDAVNNDAKVCLCDCPTGATGGTGGTGGSGSSGE
jgi:hypothetical protein